MKKKKTKLAKPVKAWGTKSSDDRIFPYAYYFKEEARRLAGPTETIIQVEIREIKRGRK